jgi:membrane protein implicated in regulation of membrane protease activity
MIDYFNSHPHTFWFSIGFLMLVIEVLALGMSTGVLLFSALGALMTGALLWLGVLPPTWLAGTACFGVSSAVAAVILWKPLLKLQNNDIPGKDNSSDLVGLKLVLRQPVTLTAPGTTRFSGIDWKIEIDPALGLEQIDAGQRVRVVSVDAGLFRVAPLEQSDSE